MQIQYNWQLLFISIMVYVISIFIAKPSITFLNPQRNNINKGTKTFFFLLIINSVFAFWEYDTYHYWNVFNKTNMYFNNEILGYEEIYNWFKRISRNNYFLWRAYIWIPACLIMYYTAKKLHLLNRNFLVAMLLFGSFLSYSRGMLGHAMLVLGCVLLVDKRNNTLTQIIGISIIALSYFFHKSMLINIIFAILAIIPFGKKSVIFSIIAYPFFSQVASYIVDVIGGGVLDVTSLDEDFKDSALRYTNSESTRRNTIGVIITIIQLLPQYITLFYLYNKVMIKRIFGIEERNVYSYLFKLTYVSFYVASLFFFVDTSDWIYERFKYMGFFPMVFILGKVFSMDKTNKTLKTIIILQMISVLWMLCYRLYKWYGL